MEAEETIKSYPKCYKSHFQLMGALNIEYNTSNSTFILWNKYEIFMYENLTFRSASKVFVPEFQIYQLISSNNIIVCLDFTGNIHTTSMKFKHSTQKRLKTNFFPREQSILNCVLYSDDKVLCLKLEQHTYYLSLHNLNAEFELQKKVKLVPTLEYRQHYKKFRNLYILKCHKIPPDLFQNLLQIFHINETVWKDFYIVIISFDKRIVYGCIFSSKTPTDETSLIKLHTTPSEICDIRLIETDHLCILISLTAGTLIRLTLNHSKATDIVHLNTAISKCIPFNDAIIYTDGVSMWKSENTFTSNINFHQFLVKQVKDIVCFGDQILCTTFTNLIYLLMLDEEASYLKSSANEYCEAGNVLDNSGYLYTILEEVDKNAKLIKKINEESNYITALSISNRPDILDNVIKYSVFVYENYEDVIKESIELILTENIKEYFTNNLLYLLIKISLEFERHKIGDVLLQVLKDLKVHITLFSEKKLIKTTSITIFEELKNFNVLIPLNSNIINSSIYINIKIVKRIPGVHDNNKVLWTIIHQKQVVLNAEHFIKSKITSNKVLFKEQECSIEDTAYKVVYDNNKHLFKFTDITNRREPDEWSFYMKLPNNYEEAFKNEDFYKQRFSCNKSIHLLKESTSKEFLEGVNNITFEIGKEKVKIEIINDGFSGTSLRVTSENMKKGFDIRNFFCNLAYNNFKECQSSQEFVRYTLYTTIENLQKAIKECITDRFKNESLKKILEQFQRDVFGALPF